MTFDPTQYGAKPVDINSIQTTNSNNQFSSTPQAEPSNNGGFLSDHPILKGISDLVGTTGLGKGISQAIFLNYTPEGKNALNLYGQGKITEDQFNQIIGGPIATNNEVLGSAAQTALTIVSPGIGKGKTALGRIGANTALGAGIGASSAVQENKGIKDVVEQGITGGLTGGALSAGAEGVGALVKNLPRWLTKAALPKLNEGNIEYALQNTKFGTTKSLLENSTKATDSYGKQIISILEHPEYINNTGDGAASLIGTIEAFPNANLTTDKVATIASKIAPGSERIVEKVADGTATLLEKNQLRQELDYATRKIFTDTPDVSFNKQVASSLANSLRNEVQGIADETVPVFEKFSKELNLNGALRAVEKKNKLKPTLTDILAAYGGFQAGGIKGATEAILAERVLKSPGGRIAGAKVIQKLGTSAPILNTVGQVIKAPVISGITSVGQ